MASIGRMIAGAAGCALVIHLGLPPDGRAQTADGLEAGAGRTAAGTRAAPAVRIVAAPVIDGRLDDDAWSAARPLAGFVQREPRDGEPVSERTEVRVVFDDDALYVAAWLYDSAPDQIVPGERRRDANLAESDAFRIVLDTFHDRQNGFVFGTNPAGIEYDGHLTNEGRGGGLIGMRQQGGAGGGFNLNWDGSWTVATHRDEHGWYAEFRIPFSTLRYPGGGGPQVWGVNFERRIARTNEEAYWAPIARQHSLFRVSQAGVLEGIEPPPVRAFTVTPYALASAQRQYALDPSFRYPVEVGGDVKVGITPSLTLDVTYNTDFAQVEVDEHQVNLTRFNLFFPEKRPFFLENAGIFAVGSGQSIQMFFSRRIGIGPDGGPVPIRGGARVTGRTAGLDVGLLHIRTAGVDGLEGAAGYSVARLARELPNRSGLGGIVVSRSVSGDAADNHTFALDGRLGIGDAITLDAVAARSSTPGLDGRDGALLLSGDYRDRNWMGRVSFQQIGEDFNPEVGFLQRSGHRAYSGFVLRHVRMPEFSWLRELRPHVSYNTYYDFSGFRETAYFHVDSHIQLENGAMFSPAVNWISEGLREPFALAEDVVVAAGTYSGWEAAWRFNTNERAAVAFTGGLDAGSFLSGRRKGVSGTLTFRHGAALAAQIRGSHNRLDLAEGAFDATLVGVRLAYSFSPDIFVQSLVQYSDQAEQWSGNLRFGWLNTAGTGLFLVYNQAQGIRGIAGPLERAFIVKFTRQLSVPAF